MLQAFGVLQLPRHPYRPRQKRFHFQAQTLIHKASNPNRECASSWPAPNQMGEND